MCGWEPRRGRTGDGDRENVSRWRPGAGVFLPVGGQVRGRSLGDRGNSASGILATRCHQELTGQKKGSAGVTRAPCPPLYVPPKGGCAARSPTSSVELGGWQSPIQEETLSVEAALSLTPAHTDPGEGRAVGGGK